MAEEESTEVRRFREAAEKIGLLKGVVTNVWSENQERIGSFRLEEIADDSKNRIFLIRNSDVDCFPAVALNRGDKVYVLASKMGEEKGQSEYDGLLDGLANITTGRTYGFFVRSAGDEPLV